MSFKYILENQHSPQTWTMNSTAGAEWRPSTPKSPTLYCCETQPESGCLLYLCIQAYASMYVYICIARILLCMSVSQFCTALLLKRLMRYIHVYVCKRRPVQPNINKRSFFIWISKSTVCAERSSHKLTAAIDVQRGITSVAAVHVVHCYADFVCRPNFDWRLVRITKSSLAQWLLLQH